MYNSICFEPINVEEEQSTNGGAVLAALGVFAGSTADVAEGKPVVWYNTARRAVFYGTAAAIGATFFGLSVPTLSLSNPEK